MLRSALLFLVIAGSLPAQSLTIVVEDSERLPVPGAHVVVRRAGETVLDARSRDDGTLRSPALQAGVYTIEASSSGFDTARREVRVGRRDVLVRMRLRLADLRTEVTVDAGAEPVSVDPGANRDAIPLDRELLDALPTMDHDFITAAEELLDPGEVAGGGVSIVVDGMETEKLDVSSSAIQEVRVNRNPYSAEYSRPGSARIEVITKQGSQEFHGELNVIARHDALDARNAFAESKPRHVRRTFEGHVTGPLGSGGRNTFVLSGERNNDDEQAVVYARTLDGLYRDNVPESEGETELSFKLNRYHNDRHSFWFRAGIDRERQTGNGAGGLTLPEAVYDTRASEQRLQVGHRWFFNPRGFTDLNVRLDRDRERAISRTDAPRLIVRDAFTAGGAQIDAREHSQRLDMAFTGSLNAGKHLLRAGILVPEIEWITIDDRENFGGTFVFASLDDYAARRPLSFRQRQGDSVLRYRTWTVAGFLQDDLQLRRNLTLSLGVRYSRQSFLRDANNFAPRAGVAWSVGDDRKTVIRAGAGIFHDRLRESRIADLLRLDGIRLRQVLITAPGWPDPVAGTLATLPQDVLRLAGGASAPYWLHSSLGVERQLAPRLSLAVTYTRARGIKMFRTLDLNAPQGPLLTRPLASFGPVREMDTWGTAKAQRLGVTLTGSVGKLFRGSVMYSLGRSFDDDYDDLPPNSLDLSREWARSDYDRRHRFRLLGSFRLPAQLELGTILSAEAGRPYEWTLGRDLNEDGEAAERPAGIRRNALEGPGSVRADVRLARRFELVDDGPELTLRLDAFNALNMVNYTRVIGNQTSPFFRQAVAASPARRLQVGMELEF